MTATATIRPRRTFFLLPGLSSAMRDAALAFGAGILRAGLEEWAAPRQKGAMCAIAFTLCAQNAGRAK